MAFTWNASLVAGQTKIENDSTGVLKEIKDNIQSLYTSLALGTVSYSQSRAKDTPIQSVDIVELRDKVNYALDNNKCRSHNATHNNGVLGTHHTTYKNAVKSRHNGTNYVSHRGGYYSTDYGTYNSSHKNAHKGAYDSARQATHRVSNHSAYNTSYNSSYNNSNYGWD